MVDDTKWVTLDMKLVNWVYLNYTLRLKLDTPLYSLKKKLVERHGRMTELRLYKENVTPENELTDEMITLGQAGVPGGLKSEPEVKFVLIYDFKPYGHDDPLLLVAGERGGTKVPDDAVSSADADMGAAGGAGGSGAA